MCVRVGYCVNVFIVMFGVVSVVNRGDWSLLS